MHTPGHVYKNLNMHEYDYNSNGCMCVFLPGHAQTGEPCGDNENIEAGKWMNSQNSVSCSQTVRQKSEDCLEEKNRLTLSSAKRHLVVVFSAALIRCFPFSDINIIANWLLSVSRQTYLAPLLVLHLGLLQQANGGKHTMWDRSPAGTWPTAR